VGGVGGAICGGLIASQQHNEDFTDFVQTDENGQVRLTRSWQDNVVILIDLNEETAISKYSTFKPQGQPTWDGKYADENKKSKNYMSIDIYLVKFDTEGGYLSNLRIAQNKVQNLTYVATQDDGGYVSDSHFTPLNMHDKSIAGQYSDECNHPEWNSTNFWRARTSVYPDGKGSDILWIESKRLIYIEDLTAVTDYRLDVIYKSGNDTEILRGAPAGAFELNDDAPENNVGNASGHYWYVQFLWCVGLADMEYPTVTIEAYIEVNGASMTTPNAGIETIDIPTPQHIITFTFSDSSLVDKVHHTVYAERSIPTVHGDLRYNLYSDGSSVRVQALGIQSLPSKWNTGAYGIVDLFYPNCSYNYYFAVENNDGDEVFRSAVEKLDFNNATMTAFTSDIDVSNITEDQSYRLTLNNEYFGATMSSTLFFQLTDYDTHNNLSQIVEDLIDDTFKVTGAGEYGNFDSSHINQLKLRFDEMNSKLKIQQQRLKDFIGDNGESNYTGECQKMIDYFNFFYGMFGKYTDMTSSEIAKKPSDFTQFRGLCNAMLMSYNHAYLYQSCAQAYLNGDIELVTELVSMMAFEDQLLTDYYNALISPPTWDLTIIVMIIIALIISAIVTVAFGRWYEKSSGWKTSDKKKLGLIFGALFGGVFAISFIIEYLFLWQPINSVFGAIPTWGR